MSTSITPGTIPASTPAPAVIEHPLARRLLSPSLSDLFFLFFVVWMFLIIPAGWERLLLDADTALHLRIGQYILSTGNVPHQDLFAFSKPPTAWYAFEWLSETTFAYVFSLVGFKGMALLAGVLIALYVTLLLKYTLWKGANGAITLVVILVAASATSIHYFARPHLFTLLFLAVAVWVMDFNRRNGGRLFWALVPLTVLWANLHPGFLIFLAILWTPRRGLRSRSMVLAPAAAGAPHGGAPTGRSRRRLRARIADQSLRNSPSHAHPRYLGLFLDQGQCDGNLSRQRRA